MRWRPRKQLRNFNPRTPRGVRLGEPGISFDKVYFNPRTPRGVRRKGHILPGGHLLFQSTHPARGATMSISSSLGIRRNFNPRTPRGVRRISP